MSTSADLITVVWKTTKYLEYQALMQAVLLSIAGIFVLLKRNYWKAMIVMFLAAVGGYAWVTYITVTVVTE